MKLVHTLFLCIDVVCSYIILSLFWLSGFFPPFLTVYTNLSFTYPSPLGNDENQSSDRIPYLLGMEERSPDNSSNVIQITATHMNGITKIWFLLQWKGAS